MVTGVDLKISGGNINTTNADPILLQFAHKIKDFGYVSASVNAYQGQFIHSAKSPAFQNMDKARLYKRTVSVYGVSASPMLAFDSFTQYKNTQINTPLLD